MTNFKIAAVQMAMSADLEENIAKAEKFIREAKGNNADLVCLPELYSGHYFCQTEDVNVFDTAETLDGRSVQSMIQLSKEIDISIIVPFFERRTQGIYHNSLVIAEEGRSLGLYRKMHIPDDPSFYEKFYFTPGDLGYKCFDSKHGKIGTLICWDQWYSEAARLTTLKGAHVICYPTAIGWDPAEKAQLGNQQRDAWIGVQRGHAISNGVYVVAANRVGFEKTDSNNGIEFWGSSFICDPQGVFIAQAGEGEEVIYADIDLKHLEDIRRIWPFLRDRRIDSYSGITKRFLDE